MRSGKGNKGTRGAICTVDMRDRWDCGDCTIAAKDRDNLQSVEK